MVLSLLGFRVIIVLSFASLFNCGNLAMGVEHDTSAAASAGPKMIRVLVVEDDFGDYDAVARALRRMHHFQALVTRAKTLESARKLISQHDYDVLLIDFNLGPEVGTRLLDEIGGRGAKAVSILLTGLVDHEVHEASLRSGATGLIVKSDVSASVLENTIRYALYTHQIEADASGVLRALLAAPGGLAA
jgi:DNA-binding NarL/FixJ family response regulator